MTRRDEKRRDEYRAAGRAGRDRQDEAVVKAGAWRAEEHGRAGRETGRGRSIDARRGPGRGIAAGLGLAGHLCLAGVRRGIYIADLKPVRA